MSRHHRAEANVTRYALLHEFYDDPGAADRLEAALDAMRSKPTAKDPEGRRKVAFTTAVAVLMCRLSDTQKSGESWTAQDTIAGRLRIHHDTVRLADQAAVNAGLMVDTKRKHHGAVKYQMLPDRFTPMPEYSGVGPVDNPEPMPDAMPDAMPEYSGPTVTSSWEVRSSPPTTSDSSSAPPPWASPPPAPPEADDDEVSTALQGIPGHPRATRVVRQLIGDALRDKGHTATTVNAYLLGSITGTPRNPAGLVTSLLRDIQPHYAPPPLAPVADHCGQCHPDDGSPDARWLFTYADGAGPMRDDSQEILGMAKCHRCHPERTRQRSRRQVAADIAADAARTVRSQSEPARYAP